MTDYINKQTGEILHTDGNRIHAYRLFKNGYHATRFRDVVTLASYRRKERKAKIKQWLKEGHHDHCNYPDWIG